MNRRSFLGCAAMAPFASNLHASRRFAVQEVASRSSIDGRSAGHALRSSVAAYSFRKELGATPPSMELADVIDFAAQQGLDGVELTSYWFREQSASYVAKLRRRAAVNGLCVSGMPIRSDFALEAGEAREKELAAVAKWIEIAGDLGAHTVRVFAGNAKPGLERAEAQKRAIDGLAQSAAVAERCGVLLALENHGFLTETAADVLALVRAVGSAHLAVNLDTGNFAKNGYAEIAALAPFAVAVQVKLVVKNESGAAEPCDYARVASTLRAASYRGYVALEFEGEGDARVEVPEHLESLVRALSA